MTATSFGGLSVRQPFAALLSFLVSKNMFAAIVFFIIFIILAYLTNPSEASFRTFLTEQSFRHHLAKLDDVDQLPSLDSNPRKSNAHRAVKHSSPPCHFANRASVALRTPKHAFHSFGIFTIAAIVPLIPTAAAADATTTALKPAKRSSSPGPSPARSGTDRDGSMISDSWFIGAFGNWWRGGIIDAWYQDVISRATVSSDEQSWSYGILGIKAIDKSNDAIGLPFSNKSSISRGTPPKLRNRERSLQRSANDTPNNNNGSDNSNKDHNTNGNLTRRRDSTPPPLPKSASLPLHATRAPPLAELRQTSGESRSLGPIQSAPPLAKQTQQVQQHLQPHPTPQQSSLVPDSPQPQPQPMGCSLPLYPRTPSALFENSPQIAELARQIEHTETAVEDLRAHLVEVQTASSKAHVQLQEEVDALRERKKREDGSKGELKTKLKGLEDQKRGCDAVRKDWEKKLRGVEAHREDVKSTAVRLDGEIKNIKSRLEEKSDNLEMGSGLADLETALAVKRGEIKRAEEAVAVLNTRTKELEEMVQKEKERLRVGKEKADSRRQDRAFLVATLLQARVSRPLSEGIDSLPPIPTSAPAITSSPWSNGPPFGVSSGPRISEESMEDRGHSPPNTDYSGGGSPDSKEFSPQLASLTLGGGGPLSSRVKGYSIFDDDIASLGQPRGFNQPSHQLGGTFLSPFGGEFPVNGPMRSPGAPGNPVDFENRSRSYLSESDPFVEREWGVLREPNPGHEALPGSSPVPFASLQPSLSSRKKNGGTLDAKAVRGNGVGLYRTSSDPSQRLLDESGFAVPGVNAGDKVDGDPQGANNGSPRRWFSMNSKSRSKKGLNPDAKEFSMGGGKTGASLFVERTAPSFELPTTNRFGSLPARCVQQQQQQHQQQHQLTQPSHYAIQQGQGHYVHHHHHCPQHHHSLSLSPSSPPSTTSAFLRAFAPSREEREALQRAMGSASNTSLDRLPSMSELASGLPPAVPPSAPAAARTQMNGGLGSLPSWLQAFPRIRKPNFSPWADEETEGQEALKQTGVVG